jgi:hypothetical protein
MIKFFKQIDHDDYASPLTLRRLLWLSLPRTGFRSKPTRQKA